MTDRAENNETTGLEIAVIGISCRFPGAGSRHEFWENLKNGVEAISFFTQQELEEAGIEPEKIAAPGYIKAKGYLSEPDYFDPAFFNYTPLEAQAMDPQLRVYHECIWTALEDAGYNPDRFPGPIGVYSGASPHPLWLMQALNRATNPSQQFDVFNLNTSSSFGTRISYNFNLKGPSFTLHTACSTSLVAVHLACQGLLNAECDLALAGGVSLDPRGKSGIFYQEGMINSPDGHCRAFDARARGTVPGEGVGVVVMKRLQEAVEDGDFIYAVVKGTAVNNDGSRKIGYTAPSVDGQAEAIKAALDIAEVEPESISYIETHGTGTALGDPIEIEALKLILKNKEKASCALGAVKSNIGHCDTAAGVAGFIKAVMVVHHRLFPPAIHFEAHNPELDFADSPLYINPGIEEWRSHGVPLRAGVSSFGIGGTNAHVILEEWPEASSTSQTTSKSQSSEVLRGGRGGGFSKKPPGKQLILLSAGTRAALDRMALNLAGHFRQTPDLDLEKAAYTLQVGRKTFKYRAFTTCSTLAEAVENLSPDEAGKLQIQSSNEKDRPVIFMFPGQGSQYVDMGRGLYLSEAVFREEMDRCFDILTSITEIDFRAILYPGQSLASGGQGAVVKNRPLHSQKTFNNKKFCSNFFKRGSATPTYEGTENPVLDREDSDINRTAITQPLLFTIEYALTKLLLSWGIKPAAMTGHSIGEYTAACLAGVFSLEDALKIVALRGALMQQMPAGDMIGVTLPEAELLPLLPGELSLAAVNGPDQCVVSGTKEAIASFDECLREKGCKTRLLHTSHAFHSAMMDPILDSFQAEIGGIALNKPAQRFISNVSGTWITAEEAVDPAYWASHLRHTVRFYQGMTRLLSEEQDAVFVEVGPGRVLSTLMRGHPRKKARHSALNLVRHPKEDVPDDRFLLEKIGRLWQWGSTIDWPALHAGEKRRRLPLPVYSFERRSFAMKWDYKKEQAGDRLDAGQRPTKTTDITRWFYAPSWKGVRLPTHRAVRIAGESCWLVLSDESAVGSGLVRRLEEERQQVIRVKQGRAFKQESEYDFTLNPLLEEDYDTLFKRLQAQGTLPERIIHLWNVTEVEPAADVDTRLKQVEQYMESGFYSLLYLPRAMTRLKLKEPVRIEAVSTQLQNVTGNEPHCPLKALLLGPVRVIPLEYPHITCRSIDIETPRGDCKQVVDDLISEFISPAADQVAALRCRSRWVRDFEPLPLDNPGADLSRLKDRGVYLITGGLGGMGLVLAAELAKNRRVRLILIDKSEFPPQAEWPTWLAGETQDPDGIVTAKIRSLQRIEKMGAELMVCSADVTDLEQMRTVMNRAKKRFGAIDGVIHAAGLPGGGLIQVRDRLQSQTVLTAKVTGAFILDALLADERLDFFFACSSIGSIMPPPGQVAYCSANSFLDSFALHKAAAGDFTLAVNWDTWQEVGMAVAAVEQSAGARPVNHPLLDKCVMESPERGIYISRFSTERFWLLDGHRILGTSTLPGTAYIEIVGAALTDFTGTSAFEIKELYLLTPLTVEDDQQKTVHTVLEKEGDYVRFSITSRSAGGERSRQEHARGRAAALKESEIKAAPLDLREAARLCGKVETGASAGKRGDRTEYLQVSRRWDNLKRWQSGADRGLAELELPADFAADLDGYKLHPAVTDAATAFLASKFRGEELYLPFLFKGIRVSAPIPAKVFSYSRLKKEAGQDAASGNNLTFHITITDETGTPCMDIEEFVLLKVSPGSNRQRAAFDGTPASRPPKPAEKPGMAADDRGDPLKDGILPDEGVEVFNSLLQGAPPQVIVSTVDFKKRLHVYRVQMSDIKLESAAGEKPGVIAHPRPEISSEYKAPANPTQQKLADIWQQFLGIGEIGISDDFFELGGDSLKGLSVISEIHKDFNVEFTISDFFAVPTIEGLAAAISSGAESIYSSIIPVEKRRYYPLSSAQKRLFFLQQIRPDSVFYNIPGISIVEGSLDDRRLRLLEEAFRAVIARQSSLRTAFHLLDEQPVQRILDPADISFSIKRKEADEAAGHADTKGQEDGGPLGTLSGLIADFIRPFDLSRPPLMRVEVVRLGDLKHLWLFDIHHIVSDATGYAVLYRELFGLYRGEELPPLRIDYKDFSLWQNRLFETGTLDRQREYWLQLFSVEVPRLNLPTDYPRPKVSRFEGEMHMFRLSREDSVKFLEVGGAAGVTLFMNLLAAMNVLLFKYTGSRDIVIGSTHVGRPNADLRDIVGMFVNLLAMRNRLRPGTRYIDFLQEVKGSTLKAFENQDMQFEMLVEELNIKVDSTRNPLFDICINVQNYEQLRVELEDLTFSPAGYKYQNSKFDMLLWANQADEEIRFMLEYSTELFKLETIRQFAGHFLEVIGQVGRNKEIKLQDIDISLDVVNPETQAPDMDFDF